MTVGLAGKHQLQNATIAVELARRFLQERQALEDASEFPLSFVAGLKAARWPGRCQTVADPVHGNLTWYLDGAHTAESLGCCMDWFLNLGVGVDFEGNSYVLLELERFKDSEPFVSSSQTKKVLIFNCTSGRSGQTFLKTIDGKITAWAKERGQSSSRFFDHVVFCTNVTYADGRFKDGKSGNVFDMRIS